MMPTDSSANRSSQTSEIGETPGEDLTTDIGGYNDEDRVITSDRAEDTVESGAIEGGGNNMRRPGRRADHDNVVGMAHLDDPVAEHPPKVILRR